MRKPHDNEKVICPDSRRRRPHTPAAVWATTGPDGKRVLYGTLGAHTHDGKACQWEGLAIEVVVG